MVSSRWIAVYIFARADLCCRSTPRLFATSFVAKSAGRRGQLRAARRLLWFGAGNEAGNLLVVDAVLSAGVTQECFAAAAWRKQAALDRLAGFWISAKRRVPWSLILTLLRTASNQVCLAMSLAAPNGMGRNLRAAFFRAEWDARKVAGTEI